MIVAENVLVTGATGFIGSRLVSRLVARGENVKCLARPTSNISQLQKLKCLIVHGDLAESSRAITDAVSNVDTIYHLAASTHAIHARNLVSINTSSTKNLLNACAACNSPPTLVFVSSLAAVGPSSGTQLLRESDPRNPVSFYGRSKADCELAALEYSDRLPISIVRPPIVLGGGDRHGLQIFDLIDRFGWHIVPGFTDRLFSLIHVDDLANVLIDVGDRGRRLSRESSSHGIYFASGDETVTYADLGRLIGRALGRSQTRIMRVGKPIMWAFAAINEVKGRLVSDAQFLNLDKFREAFAGSWACSNEKLKQEFGGVHFPPLSLRLKQTVDWYRQRGWLRALPQIELPQPSPRDVIHQ